MEAKLHDQALNFNVFAQNFRKNPAQLLAARRFNESAQKLISYAFALIGIANHDGKFRFMGAAHFG
jgi:hypothetical protein